MFDQGPLTWVRGIPFGLPPRFNGWPLSGRLASIRVTPAESGIAIPMLDGGQVFQEEPLAPGASLSRGADEITLTYLAATEEDWRLSERFAQLCRSDPREMIVWDVISDLWEIDASVRTAWPLSRRSAPLPPDVHSGEILHADGTRTALTLVSGAPGTGEIKVAADIATTADLSALAGDALEVRYYPIRLVWNVSRSIEASEPGSLAFDVTLQEFLP